RDLLSTVYRLVCIKLKQNCVKTASVSGCSRSSVHLQGGCGMQSRCLVACMAEQGQCVGARVGGGSVSMQRFCHGGQQLSPASAASVSVSAGAAVHCCTVARASRHLPLAPAFAGAMRSISDVK